MNGRTLLTELLDEATESTHAWIRENILSNQRAELSPLLEHALNSTTPASDRALMVKVAYELSDEHWDAALPGMACCELKIMGLLVTDDFFDKRDSQRLGKETVVGIWGVDTAIALGFVFQSLAREALILGYKRSPSWDLGDTLAALEWATKCQYYSQIRENELARTPLSEVTLDVYTNLIKDATAAGIAAALEIGCIIGCNSAEIRRKSKEFGMHLGCLLQIRDDLIDYVYNESLIKKGPLNDLFSRKKRLPLLVAYWEGTPCERREIERILAKNTITIEDALSITEMILNERNKKRIKDVVGRIQRKADRELRGLRGRLSAKSTLECLLELATDL